MVKKNVGGIDDAATVASQCNVADFEVCEEGWDDF